MTITYHVFNDHVEYRNENDELHREDGTDGPACEWDNGTKEWWINGKRHRIGGPAIKYNNGYKEWWIDGIKYTEKEYNKKIAEMNNPDIKDELKTIINNLNNLLEKL